MGIVAVGIVAVGIVAVFFLPLPLPRPHLLHRRIDCERWTDLASETKPHCLM